VVHVRDDTWVSTGLAVTPTGAGGVGAATDVEPVAVLDDVVGDRLASDVAPEPVITAASVTAPSVKSPIVPHP
jgi:hypothetical protein